MSSSHRLRVGAIFLLCILIGACQPEYVWREGYALSYLQANTSVILVRWRTSSGPWQDGGRFAGGAPAGPFMGIGLGRGVGDPRALLAYTKGSNLRVYEGLGFNFDARPADELAGVASAPAITHIRHDEWLIGYTRPDGMLELRPYSAAAPRRFKAPLDLTSATTHNNSVAGRPALGYSDGLLVMVWGRVADNRAFRYVAAQYRPGDTTLRVLGAGEIPLPPGGGVGEFTSSPALAHDGVSTFYLAAVYRSGLSGLTHDIIRVYRSGDGQNWSDLNVPIMGDFLTAQTHVGIAAQPNGEVILGIANGPHHGRMLRLENGVWYEPDNLPFLSRPDFAFSYRPDPFSEFALVRHQYLASSGKPDLLRPIPRSDMDLIAFTSTRDDNSEVYVVNADGSSMRNLSNNPTSDEHARWSPDGTIIAFTRTIVPAQSPTFWNEEVFVMNASDGSAQTNLTNNEALDFDGQWSPDGKRIAFNTSRDPRWFRIYTMNSADGGAIQNLTNNPDANYEPTWSPNGTKILFQVQSGANNPLDWSDLYTMKAEDGSDPSNLTNNAAMEGGARWSPHGTEIAFVRGNEIYIMNADGGGLRNLTNSPTAFDYDPSWSPDGRRIAFVSDARRPPNAEVYVITAADGSGLTRLTNNRAIVNAYDRGPEWSPDGRRIAFTSQRGGNREIYVMNADGSDQRNVSNHPRDDFDPQWKPRRPQPRLPNP